MAPHELLIGAQLEPGEPFAGVSVGHARMVITCNDCPDKRWILSPNVRTMADFDGMQEFHRAEHNLYVVGCWFHMEDLSSDHPWDFVPKDVTARQIYAVTEAEVDVDGVKGCRFTDDAGDEHFVPLARMVPYSEWGVDMMQDGSYVVEVDDASV